MSGASAQSGFQSIDSWIVEGGPRVEIQGDSVVVRRGTVWTARLYSDFVLRFEFRVQEPNSEARVFVRSRFGYLDRADVGYRVEFDRSDRRQRSRSSVGGWSETEDRRVSSSADCRARSMAGVRNPRGPGPAFGAGQRCPRHRGASARRVHWLRRSSGEPWWHRVPKRESSKAAISERFVRAGRVSCFGTGHRQAESARDREALLPRGGLTTSGLKEA
jgi:hypothetical protein